MKKTDETTVVEMKPETVEAKTVNEPLRKRSEVLEEHKVLMKENEELLKEMQEREYTVEFKDKKVFEKLYKFLEKDAKWGHTTAAGLIMLVNNLKQQRVSVKDPEWDGNVLLRAVNVTTLWQMMSSMEGRGFYEAKNFVEIMATIGQGISGAVVLVQNDNQGLRNNHEKLAKLDQLLDYGQLIEDCKPEENDEQEESNKE